MAVGSVRVVGSGYTTLHWQGQPIAYLEGFQDAGQAPVGGGMEAITPLDSRYPVEIVTSRAVEAGTITATIRELWDRPVWYHLAGLEGVGETITDIYAAIAANPNEVTCQKMIVDPRNNMIRGLVYHSCKVFRIDDSENVTLAAMSNTHTVQIAYTHKTPITAQLAS